MPQTPHASIDQLYWENPEDTEYTFLLFYETDSTDDEMVKSMYLVARPFHPIPILYRVYDGKLKVYEGILEGAACDRYNELLK